MQIQGTQHIVGMLRSQEARNMFSPPNKPETGEFQFADIDQMATAAHTQPVLVDQIFGTVQLSSSFLFLSSSFNGHIY